MKLEQHPLLRLLLALIPKLLLVQKNSPVKKIVL